MARQQTPDARYTITDNVEAIRNEVPNKNNAFINDMFGNKSGYKMAQEAEQAAYEKARPMFNDLEAYGDLDPLYTKAGEKVPTKEQLANYPPESKFNSVERNRMDSVDLLRERAAQNGLDVFEDPKSLKRFQFEQIQKFNPHDDSLGNHTWIKKPEDIKTAEEVWINGEGVTPDFNKDKVAQALKDKKVTVYSSHDIKDGVFVTPSKMEAKNYAGNGKIYSKTVPLSDVAWIDGVEGQYVETAGGSGHFLGDYRTGYLRTLNETIENPDASFIQKNGNKASFRKYDTNPEKPFDYVVQDANNKLYTKFMTDVDYLNKRIQETPNSISIRGHNLAATNNGYAVAPHDYTNNIPSLGAVVNSNNVINSAIKSVKGAYSSLKELPNTDARVILETRKLLSRQTKSPDATLAFQAKQALKEFDEAELNGSAFFY